MFLKKIIIKNNKLAFTLIELLVVIAIIGLLSTISIVALNSARLRARDVRRLSDIKQVQTAIEVYYQYNGYYPQQTNLSLRCNTDLNNALNDLNIAGLMSKAPTDPDYKASPNPRQCYEYVGLGQASSYSAVSGWYCDGRPRSDYQWSLLFSLERDNPEFIKLTNSGGAPNNEYKYCVYGPLRNGF